MNSMRRDFIAQGLATAGTIVMAMTLTLATGRVQDKTYVMKFTLPTLNDPSYQFTKNYAAAIERIGRPHQDRDLSGEPIGLHSSADRRHAIRRDSVCGHSARILCWRGRTFRGDGGARPRQFHGARATARRRSGSLEADARAGRSEGSPWRRAVHERALIFDRKGADSPPGRPQGKKFASSHRNSKLLLWNALAPPQ